MGLTSGLYTLFQMSVLTLFYNKKMLQINQPPKLMVKFLKGYSTENTNGNQLRRKHQTGIKLFIYFNKKLI